MKKRSRKRKLHSGLRLAIREAGKRSGCHPLHYHTKGKAWLAEGLGIKTQSINNWGKVPRNRLLMVHHLTGVPLSKLAPDLFKERAL